MSKISVRFFDDREVRAVWDNDCSKRKRGKADKLDPLARAVMGTDFEKKAFYDILKSH